MEKNSTVVLLCGAPGSGKSTFGKKFAEENNFVYLSSDTNRARLGKNEDDQSVSAKAFNLLKKEMNETLEQHKDVVVDATFMSRKARKDFVQIARNHDSLVRAIVFNLDKSVIVERNNKRGESGGRKVPEFIIDRMLSNYQEPTTEEFDEIIFMNK